MAKQSWRVDIVAAAKKKEKHAWNDRSGSKKNLA